MIGKLDRHFLGIGFFQANRNQKASAVFMEPADERPLVTWDSARHVQLLVAHAYACPKGINDPIRISTLRALALPFNLTALLAP